MDKVVKKNLSYRLSNCSATAASGTDTGCPASCYSVHKSMSISVHEVGGPDVKAVLHSELHCMLLFHVDAVVAEL